MPKPFSLSEAIAGKPIETRDGRKAKFIAHVHEAKEGDRIITLIENDIYTHHENGTFSTSNTFPHDDLFMSSERKEGWVNLYRMPNGGVEAGIVSESSDESKFKGFPESANYITTTKIEWEE